MDFLNFSNKDKFKKAYVILSDEDLVILFVKSRGRDLSAFNKIVDRYQKRVTQVSLRYLRNLELAEEVTQDVFIKVYSKLDTLENPKQLKSWILRITQNTCTDFYKKQKRSQELKSKVEQEMKVDQKDTNNLENNNKLNTLLESIEKLKPQDQEIIKLHYFADMKVSEIALEIGRSESAVKMRLVRCRDKLSNIVNKVTLKQKDRSKE